MRLISEMAPGAVVSSLRVEAPVFAPPMQSKDKMIKGESSAAASTPLRPGKRSEKTCLCTGRVQELNGVCGWILPYRQISHPDTWKNHGCIYLGPADFTCPASQLRPGAEVVFYLYADEYGLGAEDCDVMAKSGNKSGAASPSEHGGVITVAPLWLLEDSDDDDEDDEEADETYYKIGKTSSTKDVDTDTGLASTDDCGPLSCEEDMDSEQDEEAPYKKPEVSPPPSSPKPSSVSGMSDASTSAGSSPAPSVIAPSKRSKSAKPSVSAADDFLAELRKAREDARAALDEAKQLTAQTSVVTDTRQRLWEARGQQELELQPQPDTTKPLEDSQQSTDASSEELMQVGELPSKGAVGHYEGTCKSCSFFPVGRCTKGVDCPFCHLTHDRRAERKQRRTERIEAAIVLKAEAATQIGAPPGFANPEEIAFGSSVTVAVRTELMKMLGAPPGLEMEAPPGL